MMGTGQESINAIIFNHQLHTDFSQIHPINRAFRYGDGFFESILRVNGNMPLWLFHVDRLNRSIQYLFDSQAALLSSKTLLEEIELLCKHLSLSHARIRITCWRKGAGTYRSVSNDYDYLIEAFPLEHSPLSAELISYGYCPSIQKPQIELSNYKTNSSLYFVMAQRFAQENQWKEVIIFNSSGRVCEGSYQNIFIIKNGIFTTPPLSEGCIDGSSKRFLLELIHQQKWTYQETPLTKEEVEAADAVFFTNGIVIISPAKYDDSGQLDLLMQKARRAVGLK